MCTSDVLYISLKAKMKPTESLRATKASLKEIFQM